MVATWKEALDVVIDIIKDDWNRANTSNIKPVILDIADEGPERGKRLDLSRHDYVLCYETAHRFVLQFRDNPRQHYCGCTDD